MIDIIFLQKYEQKLFPCFSGGLLLELLLTCAFVLLSNWHQPGRVREAPFSPFISVFLTGVNTCPEGLGHPYNKHHALRKGAPKCSFDRGGGRVSKYIFYNTIPRLSFTRANSTGVVEKTSRSNDILPGLKSLAECGALVEPEVGGGLVCEEPWSGAVAEGGAGHQMAHSLWSSWDW